MNKNRSYLQILITLLAILLLVGGQPSTFSADASGPAESVIVQSSSAELAAQKVELYGGEVTSRLDIIQSVGALIPGNKLAALSADPAIVQVTPNAKTELTEYSFDRKNKRNPETDYPDVTGADLGWEQGALGNGVTVAVIDTGIAIHPSLLKTTGKKARLPVIGWADFVDGKRVPIDPNGHGTHIAGIIANAEKGSDGEYNGMAPEAKLVGVRVLDRTGAGDYEKVIQGIQWVIEHKDRYNIKVINLSLHSLVQSPYWADPLDQAVMRAWAEGITVVVAAGNDGPNAMSISVPGNTPYVITVGAFTDKYTPSDWNDDYITSFSAAGPTLDGFVKPDLVAPGAHITSTMLPGSYIARHRTANWVDGLYFSMAGTSQSAAVVSGAVAQMLSVHPELTPDEVKYRLMYTSLPWVNAEQTDVLYSIWQQGTGRLNAYDAAFAEDIQGTANNGMDIVADLNNEQHYEGYSYYDDATGRFLLHGFESFTGGYGSWAGGYGSWAGGYGSWAGGYGSWAGGYGSWAGGYGSWAGGYGSWAGGYGSWAGGYGSWAGGYGSWAGQLTDPTFIANFINGAGPSVDTTIASFEWVEEQ